MTDAHYLSSHDIRYEKEISTPKDFFIIEPKNFDDDDLYSFFQWVFIEKYKNNICFEVVPL